MTHRAGKPVEGSEIKLRKKKIDGKMRRRLLSIREIPRGQCKGHVPSHGTSTCPEQVSRGQEQLDNHAFSHVAILKD